MNESKDGINLLGEETVGNHSMALQWFLCMWLSDVCLFHWCLSTSRCCRIWGDAVGSRTCCPSDNQTGTELIFLKRSDPTHIYLSQNAFVQQGTEMTAATILMVAEWNPPHVYQYELRMSTEEHPEEQVSLYNAHCFISLAGSNLMLLISCAGMLDCSWQLVNIVGKQS